MIQKLFLFILFLTLFSQYGVCEPISIVIPNNQSKVEKTAVNILNKYLSEIYPNDEFVTTSEIPSDNSKLIFIGTVKNLSSFSNLLGSQLPTKPESYVIMQQQYNTREAGIIAGYDETGTLYAVYDLLEKLGCGFYLSFETLPDNKPEFSFSHWEISNSPEFPVRMVFNWHNFLSGISTWNLEDWNSWIEQSSKMKFNTIIVHAYGNNPMLPFEYNGQQKETGYLASTAKGRDWGTNHTNDVRRLHGANSIFPDSIFGADAAKVPDNMRTDAAVNLTQQAFETADEFGMNVAFAFDIATGTSVPENIVSTLPEKAKLKTSGTFYPNPETDEGYGYFRAQVEQIMNLYPQIDVFVPWVRYMWPDTAADWMRVEHFPEVWEREYKSVTSSVNMDNNSFTRSIFFIGKICRAYRKALNELGHEEVKLGIGTWNWHSFNTMDIFLPKDVEFFPLDWNMDFETRVAEKTLSSIDTTRKVYPIVWAHHDDHRYIGKPYTPYKNFAGLLEQRNSDGFGIIHWTNRPLDIYFKSLSNQVWEKTLNEPLKNTVKPFSRNIFESDEPVFSQYLYEWITKAAMFGRETSEYFYDMKDTDARLKKFQLGKYGNPLDYPENAIEEAQKRLVILNAIDTLTLTDQAKNWYNYFYGFEKFVISFNQNQKLLIDAFDLIEKEDFDKAKQVLSKANPEETIRQFSEFSSQVNMTRGEKGLIVSLNLRWLPDFYVFMQKLRMIPIRYNFAPTFHEYLAGSSRGRYSYFFTPEKTVWRIMGEEENGNAVKAIEGFAPENEVVQTYVESQNPLEFELGLWRPLRRLEMWQNNSLLSGEYEVECIFFDPQITPENNRIFELQIYNDAGLTLVNRKISLSEEIKFTDKPVNLRLPVTVKPNQKLYLKLIPVEGSVILNGLVIYPMD